MDLDDSDVPTRIVIQAMIEGPEKIGGRYKANLEGGITTNTAAESFDEGNEKNNVDQDEQDQLGGGKCCKQSNQLYAQFWQHNDNDPSDDKDS